MRIPQIVQINPNHSVIIISVQQLVHQTLNVKTLVEEIIVIQMDNARNVRILIIVLQLSNLFVILILFLVKALALMIHNVVTKI